jgi:nitrite reductase/ring-hydroxylating ferredoxin subunit
MSTTNALTRITEQPELDRIAEPLSRVVRGVYESAGPAGQQLKNTLHGIWLGHPVHPVFTDVPIGAWTTAYLGGDLVYDRRIGVTHADVELPEEFTAVAASDGLRDNSMIRTRVGEADILLVRQHGCVHALVHSCAHLGGPLSEGTLKDGSVVCPWHGSEFALDDGRVLNGPSTHNQPCLVVRERDGRIEVKAAG